MNISIPTILTHVDITQKIDFIRKFITTNAPQNVITIFENLIKQNIHNIQIRQIIEGILPNIKGNVELILYINAFDNTIINMIINLDIILHTIDASIIMQLLKDKIIDINVIAKINNISIEKTINIIIQFCDYDDKIKLYLYNNYIDTNNVSKLNRRCIILKLEYNLLVHMLYYNICNDIFVYIKTCVDNNMLSPKLLTFNAILLTFQKLEFTIKNDNTINQARLKGRLIGVTQLISKYCFDYLFSIPEYTDYKANFNTYYNIHTDNNKELSKQLDIICLDSYKYINSQLPWGSRYNI